MRKKLGGGGWGGEQEAESSIVCKLRCSVYSQNKYTYILRVHNPINMHDLCSDDTLSPSGNLTPHLSAVKACLISLGTHPSVSQLVACTVTSRPYKSYTSHSKKLHSHSFEPILSNKCHPEFKRS